MEASAKQGRVLVFTGDGKGKTTAALGMVVRACGHGHRALVVQFIKGGGWTGEIAGLRHLPGVTLIQTGKGFVPPLDSLRYEEHRAAAEEGLRRVGEAFIAGGQDLVVLDEVCTAVDKGLLTEAQVIEVVAQKPRRTNLVLTGRGATFAILAIADTVTEMRAHKHAYADGRPADEGVEF